MSFLKKYWCPKCKKREVATLLQRFKDNKNYQCNSCLKKFTRIQLGLKPSINKNIYTNKVRELSKYLRSKEYQVMVQRERQKGYITLNKNNI